MAAYKSALFDRRASDPPIITPIFVKLSKDSQYHIDRLLSDSRKPFESTESPPKWALPSVFKDHAVKFEAENPGIYRAILRSLPFNGQQDFKDFMEENKDVAPVFWEKLAKGPTGDALLQLMEAHREDVEPATEQSLRATPDEQTGAEQVGAEQAQLQLLSDKAEQYPTEVISEILNYAVGRAINTPNRVWLYIIPRLPKPTEGAPTEEKRAVRLEYGTRAPLHPMLTLTKSMRKNLGFIELKRQPDDVFGALFHPQRDMLFIQRNVSMPNEVKEFVAAAKAAGIEKKIRCLAVQYGMVLVHSSDLTDDGKDAKEKSIEYKNVQHLRELVNLELLFVLHQKRKGPKRDVPSERLFRLVRRPECEFAYRGSWEDRFRSLPSLLAKGDKKISPHVVHVDVRDVFGQYLSPF